MLQVADKPVRGGLGKGEGIAPEIPLEHYDGGGTHAGPDHAECGLAACEPGVEEAQAGDHDHDHGGGDEDVGLVACLVPLVEVGSCYEAISIKRGGECCALMRFDVRASDPDCGYILESPPSPAVPLNSVGAPMNVYDIFAKFSQYLLYVWVSDVYCLC